MIDLRSDTVTKPTPEMRQVIAWADVGDDVYGDDPSINELEKESARLLGKESAMFIPSGTMGNLAAILTHCERGSEVILGDKAHTFLNEVGGIAALGGIQTHILPNQSDGTLAPVDIINAIRMDDIHDPPTRLITLENTHNVCGGVPLTVEYTRQVGTIARDNQLKLHLDGARIFNAAAALGVDTAQLAEPADSVMFCLSKGLGAPVGSVLCGEEDFIHRARKTRKMLGGGMRQAGLLAAAGLYALQNHLPLLKEDHRRAKDLSKQLGEIDGLRPAYGVPASNMVYLGLDDKLPLSAEELARRLEAAGVLVGITGPRQFRMVLHLWISDEDVVSVVKAFSAALA
jgi:threonine aldolase